MSSLFQKPGCQTWTYKWAERQPNGTWKSKSESTKTANLEQAQRIQALWDEAKKCQAGQSSDSPLSLNNLIIAEIDAIERATGANEAKRAECSLIEFRKFAGNIKLTEITTELLDKYQEHRISTPRQNPKARFAKQLDSKDPTRATRRNEGRSVETVTKDINYILRLCRRNKWPVERPKKLYPQWGGKHRNRQLSLDEMRLIITHAATETERTLYMLLAITGRRLTEIVPSDRDKRHIPLLKSEVDTDAGVINTRLGKKRLGADVETRIQAIDGDLMARLIAVATSHTGDTVFPDLGECGKAFDKCLKRASIAKYDALGRKVTIHSFRHSFTTLLRRENPWDVQASLGHSDIKTTMLYMHNTSEAMVIDLKSGTGE